jgi:hypothetical protein
VPRLQDDVLLQVDVEEHDAVAHQAVASPARLRRGRSPNARRRVRSSHEPERVDSDRRETRGCSEPAYRVRSDDRAPTSAGAARWRRTISIPD